MASLTSALNTAVQALQVNQAAVQLASANIAHANDPNYTRKTLQLESVAEGSGVIGGVQISGYQDAVSAALLQQVQSQTAESGASSATNQYMQQIQNLLGTSSDQTGLTTLMDNFTSAWQDFQSSPTAAAQQEVIGSGQELAEEVTNVATGLDQIDGSVKTDIGNSVNQLNDLLKQLFQVNLQLKTAGGDTSATANLTDQRDGLVNQIAQYVNVRTVTQSDGSVSLLTSSGLSLLDGSPSLFSYDGTNITDVATGNNVNAQLNGGSIQAQMNFRADTTGTGKPASNDPSTNVIQKLRSQLDMIVTALTTTSGTPPSLAAAYDNAAGSQRVSASYQTTVQSSATSAQYTTVALNGTLQTGDVFAITVNGKSYSYTATATDTSLDQIASQLATQVNADPTVGVSAIAGTASLQLVGNTANTPFTVSPTVNSQVPELASGLFTGTNRYDFQVNSALVNGSLQLKQNSASDVVNALTATNRNFMASGVALTGVSYSGMMTGVIGAQTTAAKQVSDQASFNSDALSVSQQRYQTDTGVNLDTEIANLQVLQNSYAASARLLTVVQQMFDSLETAVAGG